MDIKNINILGIESSCDDTGIAVVNSKKQILSNIIHTQSLEQAPYLGVVPEIAARSHMNVLSNIYNQALEKANIKLKEIDAIAATAGPGLIGGVIVGTTFAKSLAFALKKPYIAINHLEGHLLSPMLNNELQFPYLMLLLSGGHSQYIAALDIGKYKLLGQTIDDAVGEAFDKTAKLLGLGYPGGPQIEKLAINGDPHRYKFPIPLYNKPGCDFSFSGLKTSIRDFIFKNEFDLQDLCASFQYTIAQILCNRTLNAINLFQEFSGSKNFAIAGGVASNKYLRSKLEELLAKHNFILYSPDSILCTDNGAMIAWAGLKRFEKGLFSELNFMPKARWPLEDL